MDHTPSLRLPEWLTVALSRLEREYGTARLVTGAERSATAACLGAFHRCIVIDCGDGQLVTIGPRGGGERMHDLKAPLR